MTSAIHVKPDARGRWTVRDAGHDRPLSEHDSATDAERFARARARRAGNAPVVIHDRYDRVRVIGRRDEGPAAA